MVATVIYVEQHILASKRAAENRVNKSYSVFHWHSDSIVFVAPWYGPLISHMWTILAEILGDGRRRSWLKMIRISSGCIYVCGIGSWKTEKIDQFLAVFGFSAPNSTYVHQWILMKFELVTAVCLLKFQPKRSTYDHISVIPPCIYFFWVPVLSGFNFRAHLWYFASNLTSLSMSKTTSLCGFWLYW